MFTNFRCLLLRITNHTNIAFPFLGLCLILFASNSPSAWGQVLHNTFHPSGYLESLQYRAPLGETNLAFFEFSGSQETDNLLQDFFTYLVDPINWDLSESTVPRTIYRTHTGVQTHQKFFNRTSMIRFGLETIIEVAHVQSIPLSKVIQGSSEQQQNLIDTVFAPYLLVETQPLSWIRIVGNLRLNVLSFDVQHACDTTCSLEPREQGNTTVPSFKGKLRFGPWMNTQFFINLGKDFYRFDDREPIGSTAEQQINQTQFLELGFVRNPGSQIEIRGSFLATRSNTYFSYNLEEEEFQAQGPSQRYGFNLKGRIRLSNQTTLAGGFTVSRNTFRKPSQPIPLTPQVIGRAALNTAWDSNWSTTLQWQYIGKRKTNNQFFPAFHTLDMFVHYQYPMGGKNGNLRASLGIINMGNHRSPYSLFHFDSGSPTNPTAALDLNHFPGQPRTIVSRISWLF